MTNIEGTVGKEMRMLELSNTDTVKTYIPGLFKDSLRFICIDSKNEK